MINKENRFDEYCYRCAQLPLDESVERIEEGSFITVKNGKVVPANKDSKKAFICIGSKREGRDQVAGKMFQKISFLVGDFMLSITNFDREASYTEDMTALSVNENGVVTVASEDDKIVAYSMGAPVNGVLRIVSA